MSSGASSLAADRHLDGSVDHRLGRFNGPHVGDSRELNWSLCRYPVIPRGEAFRNADPAVLRCRSKSRVDEAKNVHVRLDPSEDAEGVNVATVGAEKSPLSPADFKSLLSAVRKRLSDQDALFVDDGTVGSGGSAAVKTRVITSDADVALAVQYIFPRAAGTSVVNFNEDVVVYVEPSVQGPNGKPAVYVDPKQKIVIVAGTRDVSAVMRGALAAAAPLWLAAGCLPLVDAAAVESGAASTVQVGGAVNGPAFAPSLHGVVWTPSNAIARIWNSRPVSGSAAGSDRVLFHRKGGAVVSVSPAVPAGNLASSVTKVVFSSASPAKSPRPLSKEAATTSLTSSLAAFAAYQTSLQSFVQSPSIQFFEQ